MAPSRAHWTTCCERLDRSYSPETISVMMVAFDRVCQSVSKTMTESNEVKKSIALTILRHVDRGELNVERLVQIAFRESLLDLEPPPDELLVHITVGEGKSGRKKS